LPAAGAPGVFAAGVAAAGALLPAAGAALTGALAIGAAGAAVTLLLPAPAAAGTLDTGAGAVTGLVVAVTGAAIADTGGLLYAIGYIPSPSPSAATAAAASVPAFFCLLAAGCAAPLLPASSKFLKLSPSNGRCPAAPLRAPARSVIVGSTSMMCSSVLSTTPA
jgi:hypothetical protein